MKLSKLSLAALLSVVSVGAFAQAKAPEPDYTLSYNVGATTDYRYRGLSQSGKKPALQGGIDYAHKNGFYLGAWGSSISWIKDTSPGVTKGPIEVDLYGGYKGEISKAVSYDVGALQYWYTGNTLNKALANANTLEVYGAFTFGGLVTAKYSHSTTNLFGAVNSKGSGYLDLSATFDLGNGWNVVPHIGNQRIKNFSNYTDYSLTVNKDIDGLILSGALVSTNIKSKFGAPATLAGSGTKDLGGAGLVLSIKKNF
jgi:uncharacterized protein (TIGR02001 family)